MGEKAGFRGIVRVCLKSHSFSLHSGQTPKYPVVLHVLMFQVCLNLADIFQRNRKKNVSNKIAITLHNLILQNS